MKAAVVITLAAVIRATTTCATTTVITARKRTAATISMVHGVGAETLRSKAGSEPAERQYETGCEVRAKIATRNERSVKL